MVSLLKLAEITEEGVNFQSPSDGSKMLLTPERSIQVRRPAPLRGGRRAADAAPGRPKHAG